MRTISVGPFLAACLVASLAFPGCKREEEAALPAPPAATAPATAPRPPTTSYVEVVRQSYPKLPATQPLSIPLDMAYAGHWVLPDPVYLCPRGDLWITRGDALPLGEAIKKAVEEQVHLTRERVAYVQWTQDAEGKPYPRLLVHASAAATPEGGGGGYEWIDRDEVGAEQRRPATAGRAYRWDEVLPWGDRLVVPTDRGVAIFSFAPQYKEDYRDVLTRDQIAAGANPPQVLQDPRGLLVWSPWDGRRPGGRGALRLVDDKWVDLAATAQWPAKILHLVPLLDGSVLQLLRGDDDKVSVALATLDAGTIDEAAIAKLVETLSEDDPEQRAAAYAELTRFGPASWPVLERLLPEQPPEAQIRMQQILKDRIQPSLGGRTLVDGAVQLASRFADAGVLLYAPAGVSIPQQQDDKPPQIVKPAWISVRPGHAIELLEPVLTKDAAPDRQHFYAFGDEWVVSDPVQGPRRLLGNHLVPMLRKDERRFAHVVGADRRGRWLFRRSKDGAPLSLAVSPGAASPGPVSPGDAEKTSTSRPAPAQPAAGLWPSPQPTTGAASPQPASQPTTAPEGATAGAAAELASIAPADATLILDPTLPDPTPRLPVWLMHVPNGLAGWSARDFPVIKRGGGWVLVERGWQPLDESKDKLLTLGPPPKPVPVPGRPPPPNLPRDPGAAIGPLPGPAGRGGFLRRPAARPAPVAPNAVAPDAVAPDAVAPGAATRPAAATQGAVAASAPATAPVAQKPSTTPAPSAVATTTTAPTALPGVVFTEGPATTQSSLILTDADGREYHDGRQKLRVIEPRTSGGGGAGGAAPKVVEWTLPATAASDSTMPPVLIRTQDGLLFLFNAPGRVIRIKRTPDAAEPFEVEAIFTKRIPNADLRRIWLDPAGRIVIAYEGDKLAVLFPTGQIPPDIATMIPAGEMEDAP